MKQKILILFLLLLPALAGAQKTEELKHEYTYVANGDESPNQARERAANQAVVEALRQRYGTAVSGATASSLVEKNGIANSRFVSFSNTGELMGESLGYLDGYPKYDPIQWLDDGNFSIRVRVAFKARPLSNQTSIETHLLRNSTDLRFESEEYKAGDILVMKFSAPVSGYLAVYLSDGEEYNCLLPYAGDQQGFFPVRAHQEYTLFTRKTYSKGEDPNVIDEYELTTGGDHADINQIVCIFSPNKFIRPKDKEKKKNDGAMYPRILTFEEFQKWLMAARVRDKEMTVETKYITINP